jgi:hypothetical protein
VVGNGSRNFFITDRHMVHAAGAKYFANGTGLG